MSITGLPGQGPVRVGIPIDDLTAGNLLALGIMMAIFDRERTGVGRWVHTSLLEAQIFMLDFQASRWLMRREVAPQAGNDHPTGIADRRVPDQRRPHQHRRQLGARCSRASAMRSASRSGRTPEWKDRKSRARQGRKEINAAIGEVTQAQAVGILDRVAWRRGRAVRADLLDRPGVRRSAGAAPRHGDADALAGDRRRGGGGLGDQHRRAPRRSAATPERGEHGRGAGLGGIFGRRDRRDARVRRHAGLGATPAKKEQMA